MPASSTSTVSDDVARRSVARRNKVRARARAILRTAATAMRAMHQMQAELQDKKAALTEMRAAAARSRGDQAKLASDLVRLQLRQLATQRALEPASTSAAVASEKRKAELAQARESAARTKEHARRVGDMHFGVVGGAGEATSATPVCGLKSSQHPECLGLYELCRDKPLVDGRPIYRLHHDREGSQDTQYLFHTEHRYWRIGTDPHDPFSGWWRIESAAQIPNEIPTNDDGVQEWEVYDSAVGDWVLVRDIMVEPAAGPRQRTSSVARDSIPSPRFLRPASSSFEQLEPSQHQISPQLEPTELAPTPRRSVPPAAPPSPSKRGSHCPKCGTPYEPAYSFCTMCGYGFPTPTPNPPDPAR